MTSPLLGRQRVEPRGDERRGSSSGGSPPRSPPLVQDAASCSMKSGLPSAGPRHLGRLSCRRRGDGARARRRLRLQRLEGQGVVGEHAAAPARAACRAAPAGRASRSRTGRSCRRAASELDQVEERGVGPVDVLEDERRRLVSRSRFDEDPDGREEAVAIGGRRLRLEAEQDRDVAGDGLGLLLADEPLHERAQLSVATVDVVAVEDAGELLHLRRERAVCAALAIRQAAAADDATAAGRDALRELGREPRLADARTRRAP